MKEHTDTLTPLGCFPAFGKPTTPCTRCDERATAAATWLLRGEVITLAFCGEHLLDAEQWLTCNAVWLNGDSALRRGADGPRVSDKREGAVQMLLALGDR